MIVYVRVKSSVKVTFKVDPRFGAAALRSCRAAD
jgi:hypothetical protein